MAETLKPMANSAIEYHRSPITQAPQIDFPYPESRRSSDPAAEQRDDSEATLTQDAQSVNHQSHATTEQAQAAVTNRPTIANRKFETETSRAIGTRPVVAQDNRKSTSGHPTDDAPVAEQDWYSSSDESSSGAEEETLSDLNRQPSAPEKRDLAPRELNRARVHPWHEMKRRKVTMGNEHFMSQGKVAKDGRLNVKVSDLANTGYLAKALGSAIHGHLHPHAKEAKEEADNLKKGYDEKIEVERVPRMNIVIMVIGSRGDVQPFLRIGQILRDKYGHRVRIATHPAFKKFVEDEIGLEFFSIGGDPSELMSFMVRNPGLIPSFETLTSGEVGRRREQMFEMFNGFWRACINTTDDERDKANLKLLGRKSPFVADAIIANPVSFAPYHCAERLGIPLQLVFTFPYSPTREFPHPLANIKSSNVDREYTNYMSYPLVDLMTWQGLGDLINRFRVKTLGLEPVSTLWAPGQLTRMRVPMTYLWSPGLVPKPEDWGPEIDIAGYVFLDLAKSYKPPKDLVNFLKRSENDKRPIIYIGFGSIAGIADPTAFCKLILEATVQAGVKAVVSRGWGGMGDGLDIPDGVFMVDNVPHDWLFPQLDAVVHHGGAGTTAAGLRLGKPTMIVPFFGDQPFWANMIVRANAGAKHVYPLKKLTVERFATGIADCLEPSAKEHAQAIAKSIVAEGDGAENAVDSFHRGLDLEGKHSIRCSVFEDRIAVWHLRHTNVNLSALAADLLVENRKLSWDDLELIRHKKWADFSGPGEPITGVSGVVVGAFQEAFHGLDIVHENAKADLKRIERHRRRKKGRTVADAIVMPGKVAQRIRGEQKLRDEADESMDEVNLTGEDAPPRKPTIAGIVGDSGRPRPKPSRLDTTSTLNEPAPILLAKDVGKGVGHSFKAFLLLPSDMLHAVTLGFRNAPRLYGDRTVRPPPQNIKGFRQGVKVGGKELCLGLYDGSTGLVRLPYLDTKQDGIAALPAGVARGIGGLVLKPVAGTLGMIDNTNRGVNASLRKIFRDTEKTDRYLRKARIAQGSADIRELQEAEQDHHSTAGYAPARTGHQKQGHLERARTEALTRFTSHDRQEFEEAREKEKRLSIIPSRKNKSTQRSTT